MSRFNGLPGDPYLPPGCTAADIDRGCLPDGKIHCVNCGEVCDETDEELCPKCLEDSRDAD